MMLSKNYVLPLLCSLFPFWVRTLLLFGLFPSLLAFSEPSTHNTERSLLHYQETLIAIRKGDHRKTEQGIKTLKNHPLLPYLEKAKLYKRLSKLDHQTVNDFLFRYSGSVPAKQFRNKWLKHLAQKSRWNDFILYYPGHHASRKLQCLYAEALFQLGHQQASLERTTELWLSDQSMPKACDRSFKRWQQSPLKNDSIQWQRLKLALKSKNSRLARYLLSTSSAELKPYAKSLIAIYRQPQKFKHIIRHHNNDPHKNYVSDITRLGLQRLIPKQPVYANELWQGYRQKSLFSVSENKSIRQQIGRQFIASGDSNTLEWLIKNDPNGDDSFLFEWRILLALKNQQWANAKQWIKILPAGDQLEPRWQYWLARSQQQLGQLQSAAQIFSRLAKTRHYYGFMAAKQSGLPIDLKHQITPTSINPAALLANPAIQRAHAFYQLGELVPARREWYAATQQLNDQQYSAAGALAHQWGWHQQAILATAKSSYKDDITLRFPLAYQTSIMPTAQIVDIKAEWIYAITRQESAFAADALSSAGAKGLMQLRHGTAKAVAKEAGIEFKRSDLYKAEKNILLGSHYLQQLLTTFQGNRILATAAYNAGPYRVKKWLKKQPQAMAYDIWIDTLPYYETRHYVKNVLTSSVIYGHRLGYETKLIDSHEQSIAFNSAFMKE